MDRIAFKVYSRFGEGSVIVFAADRNQAKSMALGTDALMDDEYIDLNCRREPRADEYANEFKYSVLDNWNEQECRMYRDLGWYQFDNDFHCCMCEMNEWTEVPESILKYPSDDPDPYDGDGVCFECRESHKENKK